MSIADRDLRTGAMTRAKRVLPHFYSPCSLACTALLLACSSVCAQPVQRTGDFASLVDPFVGSQGDFGQLTPAASAPFGMVTLGPDTTPRNHNGYDFAATGLNGFTHTRALGVGCDGAGGDLLARLDYAGNDSGPQSIDKTSEHAGAGWYRVAYGADHIQAAMISTGSAGLIRFTLPHAGNVTFSLDPMNAYTKRIGAGWDTHDWTDLRAHMSAGTVCDRGVYHLWSASTLSLNGKVLHLPAQQDDRHRMLLHMHVGAGDVLELRTALSVIDGRSAKRTLQMQAGNTSFDVLQKRIHRAWNAELGRVRVSGGQPDRQALFYTELYHVLQTPVQIDDPDGRYRTSDGKEHQVPRGHHRYASWSIWDNYRTQLSLLALIERTRSADIAASIAELYTAGKKAWATQNEPFITVRTEHAGIVLLDDLRKGVGGFDPKTVLPLMVAESATLPRQAPDQQIETAYDDWAIGQMAHDLGQHALAARFGKQALGYRAMWTKVFRDIAPDFDTVQARGLYQGTLWQYRWAPVFDLDWLVHEGLGEQRFTAQLKQFFQRDLYNMTNEPDIQVPFLFALSNDPSYGQALVPQWRDEPENHWYTNSGKLAKPWHGKSFALSPVGFADGMDDDAGCMSAWYVWTSIGLYPLVMGEPRYVLAGPPAFKRVSIEVKPGRYAYIDRQGPGNANRIDQVSIDGRAVDGPWVEHAALLRGAHVRVVVSNVDSAAGD